MAGWLRCERCVYDKGYGPMHYSTHILIQLMALSALGLRTVLCVGVDAHGCVLHLSQSVSLRARAYTSTLLQSTFPFVFHRGLQHILHVSVKYLSYANCPPALRLCVVHLYAA